MAWRRRSIRMPGRFDPARWEITAGMGVREIVLVSAAAGQAIWLVFMTPALPLVVRLVVAVLVALMLLGIALVPIKDKPIEYHLLKFISYRMRAMGRVYRTARREDLLLRQVKEAERSLITPRTRTKHLKLQRIARVGEWGSLQPNPAVLTVIFICLVALGSLIVYTGQDGHLHLGNW